MIQFVLGILFLIFLSTVIAHRKEFISAQTRVTIFKLLAAIIGLIVLYELANSHEEAKIRELMDAYEQGKTLICDDHEVTMQTYSLETGTLTFQARKQFKEIRGLIFPIDSCHIKEER